MKYANGRPVKVGDRVEVSSGDKGTVVCSLDDNQYTPEYTMEDWSYLGFGVLVKFQQAGLVHYKEYSEDMRLIEE